MAKEEKDKLDWGSTAGSHVGELEEIFPDVYRLLGTVRFKGGFLFPRNMIVVRQGDELTIVHGIKLAEDQQARVIDALGRVTKIVRLGAFHGMDDPYYVQRYAPRVYAPPGVKHKDPVQPHVELVPGGEVPTLGAQIFRFERSSEPEVAMLLPQHGGILLTCDSLQNWEDHGGCNKRGKLMALAMGFRGGAIVGPGWRRFCEPKDEHGFKPDFERLLELPFKHLVSAHGKPLLHVAKDRVAQRIEQLYG